MRIQVFQHVSFEGLGAIQPWAESRGFPISYTRWFQGESAPAADEFDWLIVMGGPMGVHDEARYPWLVEEKRAMETAWKAGRPILGICLGAQLLAQVLGAQVTGNQHKEIGWFPVLRQPLPPHASPGGQASMGHWLAELFPESLTTFHWHGDTFTLPPGAHHLAASAGCLHQAFILGDRTVGLQFHPEAMPQGVRILMDHCDDDLTPGPYVQSPKELPGSPEDYALNGRFLDGLLAGLAARAK